MMSELEEEWSSLSSFRKIKRIARYEPLNKSDAALGMASAAVDLSVDWQGLLAEAKSASATAESKERVLDELLAVISGQPSLLEQVGGKSAV